MDLKQYCVDGELWGVRTTLEAKEVAGENSRAVIALELDHDAANCDTAYVVTVSGGDGYAKSFSFGELREAVKFYGNIIEVEELLLSKKAHIADVATMECRFAGRDLSMKEV